MNRNDNIMGLCMGLAMLFGSMLNMTGVHGLTSAAVYVLLTVVVAMKARRREIGGADNALFWLVIAFMVMIVVTDGLLYRSWMEYEWGPLKVADVKSFVMRLVVNVLIPFGVTGIVLDSKGTIRDVMKWVPALFAAYVAVLAVRLDYGILMQGVRVMMEAASGWTTNSIQVSRIGLIGFSAAMAAWMEHEGADWRRWSLMAATLAAGAVVIVAGQRGSILAMGAVMTAYTIFRFRRAKAWRLGGMWIAGAAAMAAVLIFDLMGIGERFEWLIEGKYLYRLNDYGMSWQLFTENGMMPYGTYGYYHMTGRCYPHNMILEGMVEYGVAGLLMTAAIYLLGAYYAVRLLLSKRIDGWLAGVPLMWAALGISALVSSNILYNGLFFMATGFLAALYQNEKVGRE